MKKVCSILILLSFNNFLFAQSKKEIIANQKSKIGVLENKIRALDLELSESNSLIEEFVDYNTEIIKESKSLKNALQKCDQNNISLNDTLNNLIQKLTILKSLENELILTPELFLISEDGFKYSLDANGNKIWDNKKGMWEGKWSSVMGFEIGKQCPPEFKLGNLSITKETKTDWGSFQFYRDIYYVRLGEELLLEITDRWKYDPLTQKYVPTGFIEFITVVSDRFKTNKGFGVGSTLSESLPYGRKSISVASLSCGFYFGKEMGDVQFLIDVDDFDPYSIEEPLKECWSGDVYYDCDFAVEAFPESTKISVIIYGYGCPDRPQHVGI